MIPTGNPNIPPDVQEAKEIKEKIIEKTEGVTRLEEELFLPDDIDEHDVDDDVEGTNEEGTARAEEGDVGTVEGEEGSGQFVSVHLKTYVSFSSCF
jgi:hypothetical protein